MIGTTVGEATNFIRGITFKPDQLVEVDDPDAVVCMRTKNIQRDLDESDLIAVPKALVRKAEKYLQTGDVLISSANSWELVGKCSYVGELDYLATAGGFISIIRFKKGKTHPRFLYHWLNSPRVQHTIRHLGRQTTNISNLDVNRFKQLEFPAIDYHDQARVAAILDKADGIRRKRDKAAELGAKLIKSVFSEQFGENRRSDFDIRVEQLGNHLSFVTSGSRGWAKYYAKRGARFIRSLDVQMNYISEQDVVYVNPPNSAETDRARVANGDVLLTITGSKIGRVSAIQELNSESYISQHVAILRPAGSLLPEYYSFFLSLAEGGQRQIERFQYG